MRNRIATITGVLALVLALQLGGAAGSLAQPKGQPVAAVSPTDIDTQSIVSVSAAGLSVSKLVSISLDD
ncbi:hypothetical protein ACFY8O_33910 [Streptomyces argenteolus]|uniref:Uncharacterized protein n=1 Tax=Streptomyces argenteolus TaxID=67274 RepID=A0ABW6XGQ8_9ACTN